MTKEQCSLQPNYYGSSCDFQDLQSAVQQLTTKSDAQFEELKNEKWFHRIFNMVVCPRKNNIRMAEQITSLAQAQGILIEILVRLADQDANIAGMVMQSQSDIRALAQNSAYLQERLYLLEDKSYGIKENENLKDLNSQQRNILSGCLNEASKLYAMPSNEQRLYANELLNYLNADAQVANLEDALDDLEDNAKRKILSCIITYMYLYDHTAESMEQDEQEDFIDLFDLGRKTIKSLKQQTVDTYRLRGVDGCIDRYITAPIEITEETPFEVELPEPKAAEGASEAQTEENGEEAIDTNAPREKLVLSGSIQNGGETIYKNKEIHFSSAIMNCKGMVKFINCAIHYNEDEVSRIFLGDEASLQIESSTVICHGDREKGFFIQSIENSKGLGTCTITNSTFVDNFRFIEGNFTTLDFNNNLTQGLYYPLMDIKVKTSAKIRNSRFFSHKPSFTQKYSMGIFNRFDALLYLHNDYESAEILIDNDVFVGKEHFDFIHSENQKESRMVKKSEEQEERLAIKGPSSSLFRYNKDALGTVSNCTFTNMGNCISGMDTVTNCVFDGCSYAVDTCGYEVKECRFHNCAWACQRLFGQAVVSNCQFVDCKGETLITSDYNAEIKVEDCEFSNIRLVEDGFTYYFRSMIVFSTVDTKFANAGRWSEVNRCIFNGICISRKSNRTPKSDEHAYVICAQVTSVDKFKFARARVADCTFTNCASVNSKLINTEPYDSLFGKKHNYMAVSSRNNSGLNDIGDPSSFVASSNVKLKETDANGNKIGSSLSVN